MTSECVGTCGTAQDISPVKLTLELTASGLVQERCSPKACCHLCIISRFLTQKHQVAWRRWDFCFKKSWKAAIINSFICSFIPEVMNVKGIHWPLTVCRALCEVLVTWTLTLKHDLMFLLFPKVTMTWRQSSVGIGCGNSGPFLTRNSVPWGRSSHSPRGKNIYFGGKNREKIRKNTYSGKTWGAHRTERNGEKPSLRRDTNSGACR